MAAMPHTVPCLQKVVNYGSEKQSAQNVVGHLTRCATELAAKGVIVKGVSSDNENKMLKVRKTLKDEYNTNSVVFSTPGMILQKKTCNTSR